MEPARHLDALRTGADAVLNAAVGTLDRPVPTCPEWNVAELVSHLTLTWAWATEIVRTGKRAERGESPPDGAETALLEWSRERAEVLLARLAAADPDADCWTFGMPRSRRFWIRRLALETVLHAYDAELASGQPRAIDPEIAADGVDEYLSLFVSRWVSRNPEGWDGQSLHFHRTDGEGEWLLRMGPDGAVTTERGHAKADVALRGPAEGLWLWCCGRAAPEGAGVEVLGDRSLAERWVSEIAF